jgi:predicted amino acid racemase
MPGVPRFRLAEVPPKPRAIYIESEITAMADKKTKQTGKKLSKGQRKHVRRQKAAARRAGTAV